MISFKQIFTAKRLRPSFGKWGFVAIVSLGVVVCTLSATADVLLRKSTYTCTKTDDYPEKAENNSVAEYEYNSIGLMTRNVTTRGFESPVVSETTTEYGGTNPNPPYYDWSKSYLHADGEKKFYFYNEFKRDSQNRIVSTVGINTLAEEPIADISYFMYDENGNAILFAKETKEVTISLNPFSYTLGKTTSSSKWEWCEGKKGYALASNYSQSVTEVFPDSVRKITYTDNTHEAIKSINTTYYKDGEEIGYREIQFKTVTDGSGNEERKVQYSGYLNAITETDSVAKTITELGSASFDSETGEAKRYSKTVQSFDYAQPGHDSFFMRYNWDYDKKDWSLTEHTVYKWIPASRILQVWKGMTDELDYEIKYDNNLNKLGRMYWVADNQYYIIESLPGEPCSTVECILTYYNANHQYLRKIKLDTSKYYFYPQAREWLNGRWEMPSQPFIVDRYESTFNHIGKYGTGALTEITWNNSLDCPGSETHFYYKDGARKKIDTRSWDLQKLYFDILTEDVIYGGYIYTQRCYFERKSDNIMGVKFLDYDFHGSLKSESYQEFDSKRKLVHLYNYDKQTKTHLYSYTNLLHRGSFTRNDTTYSYSGEYVRETDMLTVDKKVSFEDKEKGHSSVSVYRLNTEDMSWIPVSEKTEDISSRPVWKTYKLPENISISNGGSVSYIHPSSFKYISDSQYFNPPKKVVETDKKTVTVTYDEMTGSVSERTADYYEYETKPGLCERRHVKEINGEKTVTSEKYLMNRDGYIAAMVTQNGEKHKYFYNKNNLLLRAELDNSDGAVHTFSYYNESDEIVDYDPVNDPEDSGVRNTYENVERLNFFVEGRSIISADASEFTIYNINGILVTKSYEGHAEVPASGLYIIIGNNKSNKLIVR